MQNWYEGSCTLLTSMISWTRSEFFFLTGQWQNGKRHGRGTFHYASGARYDGEWMDNMKVSIGTKYSSIVKCRWLKLILFCCWQHGHGCYLSDNGRQYIGEFDKDRMVGDFSKFQNGWVLWNSGSFCCAKAYIYIFADCPFVFHVADMLEPTESADENIKHISCVILRHIGRLWVRIKICNMRAQFTSTTHRWPPTNILCL